LNKTITAVPGADATVVVLGAGIQGCCIALELAERGIRVDLVDREATPSTQASFWNEGKIHLGLIYAADRAERTAATMLMGALHFADNLARWGIRVDDCLSQPFTYLVHRASQLSVDQVAAHFAEVDRLYRQLHQRIGRTYLGTSSRTLFRSPDAGLVARHYDSRHVLGAFETVERSVDPQIVAARIRQKIAGHPLIRFVARSNVAAVRRESHGFSVECVSSAGDISLRRYATVVNALWDGRLRVDEGLGIVTERDLLLRYKLAIHLHLDQPVQSSPRSTTIMLGPFGDVVQFTPDRFYLSWYPACRIFASRGGSDVPDWQSLVTPEMKALAAEETISRLGEIIPAVRGLGPVRDISVVNGGAVVSWGQTDVDDPDSEVHQRYAIGVNSHDGYHSVDTGKYSMAPYFAMQAADRVAPR